MQKDERDLLDVLKFELEFLEKGGYGRSPREAWRPQFIFEDSPTVHELRLQGKAGAVHPLCSNAVGATRVPLRENSLPPYSSERSGRDPGHVVSL